MAGVLLVKPFVNAAPVPALPIGDQTVTGLHKAIWTAGANGLTYGNGTLKGPWISPQSGMAAWSIRVTQIDGNPISQDAGQGVWLAMTSDRSWGYLTGTAFAENADLTVDWSNDGGATIAKTITVTLVVTSDQTPSDGRLGTGGGGRQVNMM